MEAFNLFSGETDEGPPDAPGYRYRAARLTEAACAVRDYAFTTLLATGACKPGTTRHGASARVAEKVELKQVDRIQRYGCAISVTRSKRTRRRRAGDRGTRVTLPVK
jgi:hypothetical protein